MSGENPQEEAATPNAGLARRLRFKAGDSPTGRKRSDPMSEENPQEEAANPKEAETQSGTAAFTQADVDKIVAERLKREREATKAKYADYDDLKAKAGEKVTAEERLAELERSYAEAEARALRASVANEHGISPEDRDLFLTGTDAETLAAQAARLSERDSDRKKRSNHVPKEGDNPTPPSDDRLNFVRRLTGRD